MDYFLDTIIVGAIWQVQDNIAVDFGLRDARANGQTAGEIRAGVTFAFGVMTKGPDILSRFPLPYCMVLIDPLGHVLSVGIKPRPEDTRRARVQAYEILAPVYDWSSERFGAPVLKERKALLEAL